MANTQVDQHSKKTIAIDFDGVIHQYTGWNGEVPTGEPISGTAAALATLSSLYTLKIFSTRKWEFISEWLIKHDLMQYIHSVVNTKPLCVALIDDRAIRFNGDWHDTIGEVLHFKAYWEKDKEIL